MSGILLHLMRHGEPEGAGRLHGHGDVAPNAAGVAACIVRARPLSFARVICSDLARAQRPAAAIADARGLAYTRDPRWRELDFGGWDGLDPLDLPTDAMTGFWADPDACPPPDGERWSTLCARIDTAIGAIDTDSLVVTHAGAIRGALACLFGLDHRVSWMIALPYAAVLTLRVWPGAIPRAQIVRLVADAAP